LPLYSLETFTPLRAFRLSSVFSLQYEICYTNVLTMARPWGAFLSHARDRTPWHTRWSSRGGPRSARTRNCWLPLVDIFVIGDGEESLPWIMEKMDEIEGGPMVKTRIRAPGGQGPART